MSMNKDLADRLMRLRLEQLIARAEAGEEISPQDFATALRVYQSYEKEGLIETFVQLESLSDDDLLAAFDSPMLIDSVGQKTSRENFGHTAGRIPVVSRTTE